MFIINDVYIDVRCFNLILYFYLYKSRKFMIVGNTNETVDSDDNK